VATKDSNGKKEWKAVRTEQMARSFLESACYLVDLGDIKQSISLLKRAASLGSIEAQVNLGVALAFGTGVKVDLKMSRMWLKRAATQGSPHAAYNLGVIYRTHRDLRWAKYWFQRSLELGDEDAQEELDQMTMTPTVTQVPQKR
jgi:TPR repeat protein